MQVVRDARAETTRTALQRSTVAMEEVIRKLVHHHNCNLPCTTTPPTSESWAHAAVLLAPSPCAGADAAARIANGTWLRGFQQHVLAVKAAHTAAVVAGSVGLGARRGPNGGRVHIAAPSAGMHATTLSWTGTGCSCTHTYTTQGTRARGEWPALLYTHTQTRRPPRPANNEQAWRSSSYVF